MSELEPSIEVNESKENDTTSLQRMIAFIKTHITTLIVCVIAFLVGYFLSDFKTSLPVLVLEDDFTSGT